MDKWGLWPMSRAEASGAKRICKLNRLDNAEIPYYCTSQIMWSKHYIFPDEAVLISCLQQTHQPVINN